MLLILDGNNLAWAGYYGLERILKPEDDERRLRTAILGLGGVALGCIVRGGEPPGTKTPATPTRVVVAFDEGRPLRRRTIFPPYQTGRERDPKFIAFEPIILAAIADFIAAAASLPITIVRGKNTEADDLIAAVALAENKAPVRICSSDRDFMQLIGDRLSVYSPVRKLVITPDNFWSAVLKTETPAFPRERFLDYRALAGDPSDDLPGVPGMGSISAVRLLASTTPDACFGHPDRVRAALGRRSEAIERAFADGTAQAIVERNRQLMDLRAAAAGLSAAALAKMTSTGTWRRERFEAWFKEQRFGAVDEPALMASMDALALVDAA